MPKRTRSRSVKRRTMAVAIKRANPRVVRLARRRPESARVGMNTKYSYTRFIPVSNLSLSSTNVPLNFEWTFNQLQGYTDFTGLYDQYRITKVVIKILLTNNPDAGTLINATGANTTNWYPKLWYIPDYDGGSSEDLNSIRERQGVKCKILRPNSTFTIVVRPKILVQTYRTITTTGYGPKSMYIDVNASDVPHYGLKGVWDLQNLTPLSPFRVNIETKFHFTCKNVR